MGKDDRVLGADLGEHVAVSPPGLKSVDGERGQRREPPGCPVGQARFDEGSAPQPHGDRQPGGGRREIGLGIPQHGYAALQPARVVGPLAQQPAQAVLAHPWSEVERDEGRVRLRRGADPSLMRADEGDHRPRPWRVGSRALAGGCGDGRGSNAGLAVPQAVADEPGSGAAGQGRSDAKERPPRRRGRGSLGRTARHRLLVQGKRSRVLSHEKPSSQTCPGLVSCRAWSSCPSLRRGRRSPWRL